MEIRGQHIELSPRETELIGMVSFAFNTFPPTRFHIPFFIQLSRLISLNISEPSQVLEQAETIHQLTQQRQFILAEMTE